MKYFNDNERSCNCGCGLIVNNPRLNIMIDKAREIADTRFTVNSWCRCKFHNKSVGGSPSSSHMLGDAIDVAYENDVILGKILKGLYKAGFERVLVYQKSKFVHVDVAPDKLSPLHKLMEQG